MKTKGNQIAVPATFMRGGTSRALIFKESDLPDDQTLRHAIFLSAMGSPDPYGRQLDGMGGGISSLSKVCVVGPSSRTDADIDYTFLQIGVADRTVDAGGNCGNMSSAIGPFAVDEKIITTDVSDGPITVRIYNTNTAKLIHSTFDLSHGSAAVEGETRMIGVAGQGAGICLDFLAPAGTKGRGVLPTNNAVDSLTLANGRTLEVSIVDSANVCVFVRAQDLGLSALESPDDLNSKGQLMSCLEEIRRLAAVRMELVANDEEAKKLKSVPKVAIVGQPGDYHALDGRLIVKDAYDIAVRMLSMETPHKAIPLTGALCAATAAKLKGTVVAGSCDLSGQLIRIGTPSGILEVDADISYAQDGSLNVNKATVWRTARRLMDGHVYVPQQVQEVGS